MKSMFVCSVVTVAALLLSVNLSYAQQGRPGGWGGFGGNSLWLLQNDQVRKELEIVDDQVEQLTELQQKMREEMRELFSGMRELDAEQRQEAFAAAREKMGELQKEMQAKADKILLPHQTERLKQIGLQMQLQSRGTSRSLMEGDLAETLNITEEQKNQLEEAAKQATEEMNEKIAAAREEARQKVLQALTPEQRAQLEKLIGDEFEMSFQGRSLRGGRGGFGDRNRRGGDDSDDSTR